MNKEIISFSISEMSSETTLKEINDSQFTKIRIKAFSSGMTRHNYSFEEKVIKDCAFTILGKPLLFKYNIFTDDCSSHEDDEIQCGFVPKDEKDADITFTYDKDLDKTFMYVNAYVWNVYQEKLMDILKRDDGQKDVSVELWVINKIEHPNSTEVLEFTYNGITILGESITPACEGAKMEVIKFSSDDYLKAQKAFEKQLNNFNNEEVVSCSNGSFLYEKTSKEDNMAEATKIANSVPNGAEEVDNAEIVKTTSVSISTDTVVYGDDGKYKGCEYESHLATKTTVENTDENAIDNAVDNADKSKEDEGEKETVDNGCGDTTDNSEDEVKCSYDELLAEFNSMKADYEKLQNSFNEMSIICNELTEYKANKENEIKIQVVECALSDVSSILSADEIASWRNKSVTCANVDQFKNELKAYAFDVQKTKGQTEKETMRCSIPMVFEETEPTNLWDKLAKKL